MMSLFAQAPLALQASIPGLPVSAGQQPAWQALLRDDAVHCCCSLCSRAVHSELPHRAVKALETHQEFTERL